MCSSDAEATHTVLVAMQNWNSQISHLGCEPCDGSNGCGNFYLQNDCETLLGSGGEGGINGYCNWDASRCPGGIIPEVTWSPTMEGGISSFGPLKQGAHGLAFFLGTVTGNGDNRGCTVRGNQKVAPGPVDLELINFARDVFGDETYDTLPAGIGYCFPADVGALEQDAASPDSLVFLDEDSLTLSINGLGPSTLPEGLGGSPLDIPVMVPAYGSETCNLVTVTQVIVPASVSFAGASPTLSEIKVALVAGLPAGADVALTSVKTEVSSSMPLPTLWELGPPQSLDDVKNNLAMAYDVDPATVSVEGNRRRQLSDHVAPDNGTGGLQHRQLQGAAAATVAYTITFMGGMTDMEQLPSAAQLSESLGV